MNREKLKDELDTKFCEIIISKNISVKIDVFSYLFSGANLNYKDLSEHDNCTPQWKKIFKKWKEEGLIE